MTIVIRKAYLQDLNALLLVARETFFETFSEVNTEADMQKYLTENINESKISSELHNPNSQFFIAWENEVSIGYLKINSGSAQTELQDTSSIEIERIYVRKDFHGKKVGQLLYEKALEIAKDSRKVFIWLGVWEKNVKAIGFYERNGFAAFDKHVFKFGDDHQTDVMMKRVL